jgi:hypothetical protein
VRQSHFAAPSSALVLVIVGATAACRPAGPPAVAAGASGATAQRPGPAAARAAAGTPRARAANGWAIRPGLFFAPASSDSGRERRSEVAPGVSNLVPTAAPAEAADRLGRFVYTGSITVDGRTMALIEDRVTHEGWYVAEGDTWQGRLVAAIRPDAISLAVGSGAQTLARSDAFTLTPLSADAPGMTQPPAASQIASADASPAEDANGAPQAERELTLSYGVRRDEAVSLESLSNSIDFSVQADLSVQGAPVDVETSAPLALPMTESDGRAAGNL